MTIRKILKTICTALVLATAIGVVHFRDPWNGLKGPTATRAGTDQTLYLPVTIQTYPFDPIFGVQLNQLTVSGGIDEAASLKSRWTRRNGIRWLDVQPTEADPYEWANVAHLEQELINASARGLQVILIITGTPDWAQAVTGYSCGPVQPAKLNDFALFIEALVTRYREPPYNVKYWELWNEPDLAPELALSPDSGFGCWGDNSDPFYGGGDYADMLEVVYPVIKNSDPDAQVLVGGLLMDCDPDPPGNCPGLHGPNPMSFFEGILSHHGANDGANFFDGVSFHAYDYYEGTLGNYSNPNWGTSWNNGGPVLEAKVDFIQNLLAAYGVTGKYLINSESALICDSCADEPTYEVTKAIYLTHNYSHALANQLRANIWYNLFGWRNSGLINGDLTQKIAYGAFSFGREMFQDGVSLGELNASHIQGDTNNIHGYRVLRRDREVWVLWSVDGLNHTIELVPGYPVAIYDNLGNPIGITDNPTIGITPYYIEWMRQ